MMERLSAGWRGRRVLLVGGENGLCDAMKAMLTEIGARATCVGTDADAQTLCAVHAPVGRPKLTHTDSGIGRVARLARRSSPHNHPALRGGLPNAGCRVWRAAAGRAGV